MAKHEASKNEEREGETENKYGDERTGQKRRDKVSKLKRIGK